MAQVREDNLYEFNISDSDSVSSSVVVMYTQAMGSNEWKEVGNF